MSYLFFPNPTPVFPVLSPLTWSVHKKVISSSRATTAVTGRSNQLACAAYPRWQFLLSYGGQNSWLRDQTQNIDIDPRLTGFTELEQLSGLFFQCIGSYGEFFFSDPDDNSRANAPIGNYVPGKTNYPIMVPWGTGPFTPGFSFPVGGVQSIDAVYANSVLINPSFYTLDATKTELVFTTPIGGGFLTIDFHFYYRCRFLDDNINFSEWALNLWEAKEVKIESVKP